MRKQAKRPLGVSYGACFSPDGCLLATFGRDVVMWSCPRIAKLWRSHPLPNPSRFAFSPDSAMLAVKGTSGRIVVLSTASGETLADFRNESDGEGCNVLFSDDGQYILDGSWNGSHVVRKLDGSTVFREAFNGEMIGGIFRHPDGRFWFRHGWRSADQPAGSPEERLIGRTAPFAVGRFDEVRFPFGRYGDASFCPDGSSIAVLDGPEPATLAIAPFPSTTTARRTAPMPGLGVQRRVCYSPDGALIAAVGSDRCFVVASSDLSIHTQLDVKYGSDVAFSPDGSLVAIGSWSAGMVLATEDLLEAASL